LAIALVDSLDVFGLGIAFAIAYLFGAVIAAVVLAATTPLWSITHLARPLGRYVVAGSAMSLVTWVTSQSLSAEGALQSLATVLLAGVPGIAAYLVVLVVIRDQDLRNVARLYLERKTTKSSR